MPTALDDATRAIIRATVPALDAHGLAIMTEMYRRLLTTPEIRDLFNQSHQKDGEQPRALALAVLAYARNIDRLDALGGMVERIAEKHVGLNILPEHYPFVADALLGAIGHVLGEAATPAILEAWGKAYWFLADILTGREAQIYRAHETAPGGWRGWRPFVVRKRTAETPVITSFELTPQDGGPIARHKAGQYLSFNLNLPEHGPQRRNYSISSAPGADHYRITVRRAPGGVVSQWLHDSIQEGATLLVSNPAGDFTLPDSPSGSSVFLTAGVGSTPVISMLQELATRPTAKIHYVHAAHSAADDLFVEDIRRGAAEGALTADLFYTHAAAPPSKGVTAREGRITADWLRATVERDATYYVCGPEGFMRDMTRTLREIGLPPAQICYEFFGSATDVELVL
ncbi:NO-inducible flavohemoprotein [Acetobacter sp. DsW_063]|uniref:NO-inducible flavohemoprotein n=1 Tax=Acetobacter sp. DsW_063 TaxID=1514894 RepID=UPI000A3C565D|nr:NO-inducible flavohemoprotein [Acetobacter sp. DsW_063]OUJ16820.1 dihydropteridine reductase [Acetobacter sp. DsW_063]